MSGSRLLTAATALLLVVLMAGCTGGTQQRQRPAEPVDPQVAALVAGLAEGDLSQVPASSNELAEADLADILKGMDGYLPTVTADEPGYDGGLATVVLHYTWPFPSGDWTYDATATFRADDDRWVLQWEPSLVHPELTSQSRLVHTRTQATRGKIVGKSNTVLMKQMPVLRLGIDKTKVSGRDAVDSATRLAKLLDINAKAFVQRVRDAGDQAFVEALVVRGSRADVSPRFGDIDGAVILDAERVLATRPGVATNILGTAGEATAEIVENSDGRVQPGDTVGLSGLQQRYDEQLAGKPGATVTLVPRPPVVIATDPEPSQGASGQAEPSDPGQSPAATPSGERKVLVELDPVAGKNVKTTLDIKLQARAEKLVASSKSPAAMAVVDPRTGAVRVLAVSRSARGQQLANTGRYAPGSTFKIVTALALLRSGLKPTSTVNCPATTTVDGRVIKNYTDFPADRIGRMSLTEAIALSCNTAFVNERDRLSGKALREAAASLGMGVDHDAGFPVFYGDVPKPENVVGLAEASFGQGTVQASPLAMAGVAASVSAGRTTVPYLIDDNRPKQKGKALTRSEAKDLRTMMRAVVTAGSGRTLSGLATGAKTGTAEYGNAKPPKTHAWMIAYNSDLAVAMMVTDGTSGSGTAGPYIHDLLS